MPSSSLCTDVPFSLRKLSLIIKTDDVTSGRGDVNGLNNYSNKLQLYASGN